jgi:hypothetical protein
MAMPGGKVRGEQLTAVAEQDKVIFGPLSPTTCAESA